MLFSLMHHGVVANINLKKKIKLYLSNICLIDICNNIKNTNIIVLKVPFNYDFNYFFRKIKYKNITVNRFKKMIIIFIMLFTTK